MAQLLSEAFLLTLGAIALGVALAQLALPAFGAMVDRPLRLDLLRPATWVTAAALTGLVTLAAGYAPAAVLSRLRAVEALRPVRQASVGGWSRALVTCQFALAVFLVATTLAMRQQVDHVRNKELGFDREQLMSFGMPSAALLDKVGLLRQELAAEPTVLGVSEMHPPPGRGYGEVTLRRGDEELRVYRFEVRPEALGVAGIRLLAGRNFDGDLATDPQECVLINQTLARQLGLDDPVGQILGVVGVDWEPRIIGVVQDFNFRQLYQPVEPAILRAVPADAPIGDVIVRLRAGQIPEGMAAVRAAFERIAPGERIYPVFLDEVFDGFYRAEERWTRVVAWAASLATGIACLGLFGLAGFVAAQRTKEIGVRRALGATPAQVLGLLYGQFGRLVSVASVAGGVAAWWVIQRWLQDFAYRAEPGLAVFGGAAVVAIAAVSASVSWQAVRAALSNPVDALRHE